VDLHELAERRSLAIHGEVARRLVGDPKVLERARQVLQEGRASGRFSQYYADAWGRWLDRSLAELCEFLSSDSEEARALRQASPFLGIVSPRERWRIWRDVRQACGR
jgi:hypothetical protein